MAKKERKSMTCITITLQPSGNAITKPIYGKSATIYIMTQPTITTVICTTTTTT